MAEVKKVLVQELKEEGYEGVVQIYLVNDSYLSIDYLGKEVYFTKDKEMAPYFAKVILFFYKNLSRGLKLFSEVENEEEKWNAFFKFLGHESKNSPLGRDLCMAIYFSVEDAYFDQVDQKFDDVKILSQRNAIRNKDNLMLAIHQINALKNPKEANTNLGRYKRIRNQFVSGNPKLQLGEF